MSKKKTRYIDSLNIFKIFKKPENKDKNIVTKYCYLNQTKNQKKEKQRKPKFISNQMITIFLEPKTIIEAKENRKPKYNQDTNRSL